MRFALFFQQYNSKALLAYLFLSLCTRKISPLFCSRAFVMVSPPLMLQWSFNGHRLSCQLFLSLQ